MSWLLLFLAAVVAGAINSVAGGGSFVSFPALYAAHVAPIVANATNTVALWPAGLASAYAYRKDMRHPARTLVALGAASFVGGALGALLLLRTSNDAFMRLLPWLILVAAALFTFGGKVTAKLRVRPPLDISSAPGEGALSSALGRQVRGSASARSTLGGRETAGALLVATALQLVISVYGGYFGGGMGILMLATLSMMGMSNIHAMNGLKTLLGAIINGVGVVTFILAGAVDWNTGGVMIAGATLGGYGGAVIARRMDPKWIRGFVIVVAWSMTAVFFFQSYGRPLIE